MTVVLCLLGCASPSGSFDLADVEGGLHCAEEADILRCSLPASDTTLTLQRHSRVPRLPRHVELTHPVLECRLSDEAFGGDVVRRVMCDVEEEAFQFVAHTTGMDAASFAPIANDLIRKVHVKAFDDACRKATGQPCAPLELP